MNSYKLARNGIKFRKFIDRHGLVNVSPGYGGCVRLLWAALDNPRIENGCIYGVTSWVRSLALPGFQSWHLFGPNGHAGCICHAATRSNPSLLEGLSSKTKPKISQEVQVALKLKWVSRNGDDRVEKINHGINNSVNYTSKKDPNKVGRRYGAPAAD